MVKKISQRFDSSKSIRDSDYAPIVVKAIAIYAYISAALGIIGGILLLLGGQILTGLMPIEQLPEYAGEVAGIALTVIAILIILFSIFWIFVARGLWTYKNWARIVTIVFSVIGVLSSIMVLPAGIITLLIDAAIVYFLGFDKNVRSLFSRKQNI